MTYNYYVIRLDHCCPLKINLLEKDILSQTLEEYLFDPTDYTRATVIGSVLKRLIKVNDTSTSHMFDALGNDINKSSYLI